MFGGRGSGIYAVGALTACLILALSLGGGGVAGGADRRLVYAAVAGVLALSGKRQVESATPPVPERDRRECEGGCPVDEATRQGSQAVGTRPGERRSRRDASEIATLGRTSGRRRPRCREDRRQGPGQDKFEEVKQIASRPEAREVAGHAREMTPETAGQAVSAAGARVRRTRCRCTSRVPRRWFVRRVSSGESGREEIMARALSRSTSPRPSVSDERAAPDSPTDLKARSWRGVLQAHGQGVQGGQPHRVGRRADLLRHPRDLPGASSRWSRSWG